MEIKLKSHDDFYDRAAKQVEELLSFTLSEKGTCIKVQLNPELNGFIISYQNEDWLLELASKTYFMRALSLLIPKIKQEDFTLLKEEPVYEQLGFMLDCSRNAVPHFESYQQLIKSITLMGYTTVQLYLEDIYEVKDYPYFGYLRGRYTETDLKKMDDYAATLGIELVPAIQTLAHLKQILKWPAFSDVWDVEDIILLDEPKTYTLIDSMFKTLSQSFTTKHINIGMDEAHMIGLGKYLDRHGYQDRLTIMLKHFNRVVEIARKYGFKCMMWSDMFFRLASQGQYYQSDIQLNPKIKDMIPDDLTLIYWDYYSEQKETYDTMIQKHFSLTPHILFAGGAWKWMGYQPNNAFSHKVATLAHKSCKDNGIKQIMITSWGDNGAECSMFANLPSLQYWAELMYRDQVTMEELKQRFKTCTQGDYQDFMTLDDPTFTPGNESPGKCSVNPPKYLFYQDPLCGIFDRHLEPTSFSAHFKQCVNTYEQILLKPSPWNYLFKTQLTFCQFLELKCRVGIDLRQAYQQQDREALQVIKDRVLPQLTRLLEQFTNDYHEQWLRESKVFGLDVFDLKMGGLKQRLQTAIERLTQYLNQDIEHLEELEQEILFFDGREHEIDDLNLSISLWHRMVTSSLIASV